MSNLNITYQIERNPIINIEYNNKITNKILCIGDPHLGRVFRTGVPAHRVGEREEGQYAALRRLLNPTDPLITHIVIMGDLFDKFVVSPTVVLKAVELLQEASNTNPNVEYYVIPGNHDMTKDTSKKSSYELVVNMVLKIVIVMLLLNLVCSLISTLIIKIALILLLVYILKLIMLSKF